MVVSTQERVTVPPFRSEVRRDFYRNPIAFGRVLPIRGGDHDQVHGAHDRLYLLGLDHTPGRLTLADTAVKNALRLGPDSGNAHLALGQHLYSNLDYDGARAEIGIAHRTLPNNPRIFELSGYIDRRQGGWEESTRNFERALDLDPRNVPTLQNVAYNYTHLRDYAKGGAAFDRVVAVKPDRPDIP